MAIKISEFRNEKQRKYLEGFYKRHKVKKESQRGEALLRSLGPINFSADFTSEQKIMAMEDTLLALMCIEE
jgi:hypothetical protein